MIETGVFVDPVAYGHLSKLYSDQEIERVVLAYINQVTCRPLFSTVHTFTPWPAGGRPVLRAEPGPAGGLDCDLPGDPDKLPVRQPGGPAGEAVGVILSVQRC